MITDSRILEAIDRQAPRLKIPPGSTLHAKATLAAITWPETAWGTRWKAGLFEPAYYRGGKFYKAEHVKHLVHTYESLASCSYGPWQILFIAAYEVGFRGDPWELIQPSISAMAVVDLLNKRCFNVWHDAPTPELEAPASTPNQVADMWNSGSWRDRFIPGNYVGTFIDGYAEALAFYLDRDPLAPVMA